VADALPHRLQLFDVTTGKVVARWAGHDEEVLCVEPCRFRGASYLLSSSQDGHIIKWRMSDDYAQVTELTRMADKRTCMAFAVAFVPHTGNRFFVGACDEHVRLYDFEHAQVRLPLLAGVAVLLTSNGSLPLTHEGGRDGRASCSCCKRLTWALARTATLCSL
jgi:WD40 repeat protein